MLKPKQPALRHFAVLDCLKSGRFGSVWSVHDRRGSPKTQYLLVPSRIKPWPVLLSLLEDLQPIPVKLRNGRVGVLISGVELGQVLSSLRKRSKSSDLSLDALNGFVQTSKVKTFPRAIVLGFCILVAVSVVLIPQHNSRQAAVSFPRGVKSTVEPCTTGPQVNQRLEGSSKRFSSVQLGEEQYTIANVSKLGGLAQLKLKRRCDSKFFRVDAWISPNQLTISKVY